MKWRWGGSANSTLLHRSLEEMWYCLQNQAAKIPSANTGTCHHPNNGTCLTHMGGGFLPASVLGGFGNLQERGGGVELTGTKLHKNSHSKALRKGKKRQFEGPSTAPRSLGARALVARSLLHPEKTHFASSLKQSSLNIWNCNKAWKVAHKQPRQAPAQRPHARARGTFCTGQLPRSAPQQHTNPTKPVMGLLRQAGEPPGSQVGKSQSHLLLLPFWQLVITLPVTLWKNYRSRSSDFASEENMFAYPVDMQMSI